MALQNNDAQDVLHNQAVRDALLPTLRGFQTLSQSNSHASPETLQLIQGYIFVLMGALEDAGIATPNLALIINPNAFIVSA